LFQASKELGITAPGPQEDLQLLEKAVIAESFWKQRGAGGPRSSDLRLSSPRVFFSGGMGEQYEFESPGGD